MTNDCEAEWKVNQESMMKGGMTEDSYIQQCSVKDDVPAIPEPKAVPSYQNKCAQEFADAVSRARSLAAKLYSAAPEMRSEQGDQLCASPISAGYFLRYDRDRWHDNTKGRRSSCNDRCADVRANPR